MTGARILLVEDDDLNQRLVPAVLARSADPVLRAAVVVRADSLAQARAVLAGGGVDLVLLDLHLPDGNGLALATELRESGGGRPPAVVAVTGAAEQQRGAALAAGCAAVLSKPYSPAGLREVLAAWLPPPPGQSRRPASDGRP